MRCHFRHGAMKGIVKTSVMLRLGKNGLRGSNERQSLRDVQRREMCGGAKFVQYLGRDELMCAQLGSAMHDAMSYCHRRAVNVLPDCRSDGRKRIALRLVDVITLHQYFSVSGINLQSAIATSNTCCASS